LFSGVCSCYFSVPDPVFDVDLDGTDSSDGDSDSDISVTFGTDSSGDSFASATETGASVNFGGGLANDPYSINTDDDGTVADSTTGMSMIEHGEFDDSATRIELANENSNEAGSEAEDPTDWTSEAGLVQDGLPPVLWSTSNGRVC
jgi:hypothetical protein